MEVLPQRQAAVQMVGLHKMILIFSCLNTTIGVRAGVGRVGGGGVVRQPQSLGDSEQQEKIWARPIFRFPCFFITLKRQIFYILT